MPPTLANLQASVRRMKSAMQSLKDRYDAEESTYIAWVAANSAWMELDVTLDGYTRSLEAKPPRQKKAVSSYERKMK